MPTDQELMVQVKLGDQAAFSALCRKYSKRIFSYILGKVKRKELAEEISQEAFLSVFKNKDKFIAGDSKFSSWLYKIAKNAMIDSVRSKKSKLEVLVDEMPDPGFYVRDIPTELSYMAAINSLPTNLAATFNAVCINGMNHNEASKLLGITPDNVRARASRARAQLRSIIAAG